LTAAERTEKELRVKWPRGEEREEYIFRVFSEKQKFHVTHLLREKQKYEVKNVSIKNKKGAALAEMHD